MPHHHFNAFDRSEHARTQTHRDKVAQAEVLAECHRRCGA